MPDSFNTFILVQSTSTPVAATPTATLPQYQVSTQAGVSAMAAPATTSDSRYQVLMKMIEELGKDIRSFLFLYYLKYAIIICKIKRGLGFRIGTWAHKLKLPSQFY
jgi:histidinol phosphatase-like enzyme